MFKWSILFVLLLVIALMAISSIECFPHATSGEVMLNIFLKLLYFKCFHFSKRVLKLTNNACQENVAKEGAHNWYVNRLDLSWQLLIYKFLTTYVVFV